MTTYGTMQTRIANEISASSLTSEIQESIQSAISYYESHRFAFNQGELTFTTVADQVAYGTSDNSNIPDIFKIDAAKAGETGWACTVTPATYESVFDSLSYDAGGTPELITYRDSQIYLAPTPSAGYTVTVAYVKKLSTLSDSADSNAWMTDGERLIRFRAKWELFENVLTQYQDADRMSMAEMREYRNLMKERKQLVDRAPARLAEVTNVVSGSGYNIYGDTF